MSRFAEADRLRGGVGLLPGEHLLADVPRLYATEKTPAAEKVIHLKFFVASATWLVAELGEDRRIVFGYCDLGLGFPEWGYGDANELRAMVASPYGFPMVVERDLAWYPRPFSDCI